MTKGIHYLHNMLCFVLDMRNTMGVISNSRGSSQGMFRTQESQIRHRFRPPLSHPSSGIIPIVHHPG